MEKKITPPYLPFNTFLAEINKLSGTAPEYINKEMFDVPESVKPRILQALKFFGFIEHDGKVTPLLQRFLVVIEEERKILMSELLMSNYNEILKFGLENIEFEQLHNEVKNHFNVSGSTINRIISFLLQAAQYADIPMNPELDIRSRTVVIDMGDNISTAKPKQEHTKRQTSTRLEPLPQNSHTIKLGSGGSVTLQVSIPIFDLSKSDREFVFELIDKLKDYDKDNI